MTHSHQEARTRKEMNRNQQEQQQLVIFPSNPRRPTNSVIVTEWKAYIHQLQQSTHDMHAHMQAWFQMMVPHVAALSAVNPDIVTRRMQSMITSNEEKIARAQHHLQRLIRNRLHKWAAASEADEADDVSQMVERLNLDDHWPHACKHH